MTWMASSVAGDETVVHAGLQYWETYPASLDGVFRMSLFLFSYSLLTNYARAGEFGDQGDFTPTAYVTKHDGRS